MPTITTLIPAYKKEFLGETLLGLARQTFRDFRVIVSDDSPGDEITQLIQSGHYGDLRARWTSRSCAARRTPASTTSR